MSPKGCHFFSDDGGFGKAATQEYNYSLAVVLPNGTVKISGQGGWTKDGEILSDLEDQFSQAFDNVENVLQIAGCSNGWGDVYLVRAFVVDITDETNEILKRVIKEKWGDRTRPVFTFVGTPRLALEEMRIEIEVEAIKP